MRLRAWALCAFAVLRNAVEAVVERLSPTSGGLCGGTKLSIYGSGFSSNISASQVLIGENECKIETATASLLVCQVGYRDTQVVTGHETVSELVTVTSNGVPVPMAEPLEFTFKADAAPLVVDFGPTAGQANDVLSFQGNTLLFGASIEMSGQECKVKSAKDNILQCIPPPREAGICEIHVYFGPQRGYACQGPRAPPLKFTYNLVLQSVSPAEWGADAIGPRDGQGGNLVVVGQGLGSSTSFRLCGGETWCSPQSVPALDPPMYHSGDWSFQTVECKPGPLENIQDATESRSCDFIAEAADGMFRSVVKDAWTYGPTIVTTSTVRTSVSPPIVPAPAPAPAPAPMEALAPAAQALAWAPAAVPMLSPAPMPSLLPMAKAVLVPDSLPREEDVSQQQDQNSTIRAGERRTRRVLRRAATNALRNVFENIANRLGRRDLGRRDESPTQRRMREPYYPVSQQALSPSHIYELPNAPAPATSAVFLGATSHHKSIERKA